MQLVIADSRSSSAPAARPTWTRLIATLALGAGCLIGAAGCAELDDKPETSDVKGGVDGKAEAWGPSDSAALFSASLE